MIPTILTRQEPAVGMTVLKEFANGKYWGTITSIDVDEKENKLYHIEYDDGDEEDLEYNECVEVLSAKDE